MSKNTNNENLNQTPNASANNMEDLNLRIIDDQKPKASALSSEFIARKIGMTSIFLNSGTLLPVTLLEVIKSVVVRKVSNLSAVVLLKECGGRLNNPEAGIVNKALGKNPCKKGSFKTIRIYNNDLEVGSDLSVMNSLDLGDLVDITARTKGHGFTGRMKKHNHSGCGASHGVSLAHRTGGSNGMFQNRSRTKPGCPMAGRHGFEQVTMQNLQIVGLENSRDLILVHGSVPGPKGATVRVRRAIKI